MGKDWAKGLTKSTDPRVARAAAAHRGLHYRRLVPIEQCKWSRVEPRVALDWSHELAYAVGLIATDGCLASKVKLITLVSKDIQLLMTYLRCLRRSGSVRLHAREGPAFHVQFKDARFYEWLMSIGITPRKSLTLGAIDVPDGYLISLTRGLLDGDGSVRFDTVVPNPRRYPNLTYPRINVLFHSASRGHLQWLQARLSALLGISGLLLTSNDPSRANPMYRLKFAKHASITLLTELYRDPKAPRLDRKWETWQRYLIQARPTRPWTSRAPARGDLDVDSVPEEGFEPSLDRV